MFSKRDLSGYNNFPLKVVNNITDQELSQPAQQEATKLQSKETQKTLQLMVPYSRYQGHKLLSKMKKILKGNPDFQGILN